MPSENPSASATIMIRVGRKVPKLRRAIIAPRLATSSIAVESPCGEIETASWDSSSARHSMPSEVSLTRPWRAVVLRREPMIAAWRSRLSVPSTLPCRLQRAEPRRPAGAGAERRMLLSARAASMKRPSIPASLAICLSSSVVNPSARARPRSSAEVPASDCSSMARRRISATSALSWRCSAGSSMAERGEGAR